MAIDPFSPAKTDHRLGGRAAVNPSRACGEPTESVIRTCESRGPRQWALSRRNLGCRA